MQRTKEQFSLQLLEDELLKTRENLESCSFITSHILRAHVARIIGLLSLLKHPENDGFEINNIMAKLRKELIHLNASIEETKNLFSDAIFRIDD